MDAVLVLAGKDLRLLLRDKAGFFFIAIFPLLYGTFFGTIFAGQSDNDGGTKISIIIVDEDTTDQSAQFVQTLIEAEEFRAEIGEDRASAIDMVRSGKRIACIILKPGFGEASGRMFWGEPARLEVGVDPSHKAESGMITGLLSKYSYARIQNTLSDPEASKSSVRDALKNMENDTDMPVATRVVLASFLKSIDTFYTLLSGIQNEGGTGTGLQSWTPVEIEEIDIQRERSGFPSNSYAISFPQAITWGVMSAAAGFCISLVTERTRGTLVRLRVAPISRAQILAGKGLACYVVTMCVQIGLLLLARFAFDVRPGSVALLALAVMSVSICFVGIMMLLSCVGKTEAAAGGIGWAVLVVMAMIGGGMVPLSIMPGWMSTIGSISPVKWAIRALEGAIWRGDTFVEMLFPCGILLAIGTLSLVLGVRIFRWSVQ